jgi:hypothetical protein
MELTAEEQERGELSPQRLELACQRLSEVGYVIFEQALPLSLMEEVREALEANGSQPEGKERHDHFLRGALVDPRIIDNPFALQVIEAAMGPKFFSSLPYGCNSTQRDSIYWNDAEKQWIHRDGGHLFPELGVVLPVTRIVVNIPLIDFTLENGCTEIWPGSHLIVDPVTTPETEDEALFADYHVCSEERGATLPSVRMVMPAGSVVVRDMRCWHRAMPNYTDQVRTMTAMVYFHRLHNVLGDHGVWSGIPDTVWRQLPARSQQIYRFHLVS